MSDVKSRFEAALAQRKKQKAEEAIRGNYNGSSSFPDIPYSPLHTDKQQVFRFIGIPYPEREKPTDSKRVHIAMILGDDDKKFRCIGPDPKIQKDWILYRVMNKVLTKHWDKNIPGSNGQLGAYVYDYANVHPELYSRVAKNNNVENKMEKGWRFDPYILFNVIDRANYSWHVEKKKLRVLSKKASEWQDKIFFEPGVPDTVYQLIMDDIVAVDGNTNWEDYDIAIRKLADKPWYKVYHAVDQNKYLDADVRNLVVNGGLTKEESSWEGNDFDKLFPVTYYNRIKSKLGIFFQKVDKVFNSKYYEELCLLVEKEDQEIADQRLEANDIEYPVEEEKNEEIQSSPVQTASIQSSSSTAIPQTNSASPPVRTASASTNDITFMTDEIWANLANGSYNGKQYVGVPKMTPADKALVKGIRKDGSFEWLPEAGELYEGSSSHFITAEKCKVDPLDGTVFD